MARLLRRDTWACGQTAQAVRVFGTAAVAAPLKPRSLAELVRSEAVSGYVLIPTEAGVRKLTFSRTPPPSPPPSLSPSCLHPPPNPPPLTLALPWP